MAFKKGTNHQTLPGRPVSEDAIDGDTNSIARTLIRELELGESELSGQSRDLSHAFGGFLNLPDSTFRRVGLDLAVVAGISGDWNLSLRAAVKMVASDDDRAQVRLWQLRSLVECSRFAEALALSQALRWESQHLIHVNYLTGLAFEALGMREQARLRFDAVRRQDAGYRDVQLKG